jgi:hypothetical protein
LVARGTTVVGFVVVEAIVTLTDIPDKASIRETVITVNPVHTFRTNWIHALVAVR